MGGHARYCKAWPTSDARDSGSGIDSASSDSEAESGSSEDRDAGAATHAAAGDADSGNKGAGGEQKPDSPREKKRTRRRDVKVVHDSARLLWPKRAAATLNKIDALVLKERRVTESGDEDHVTEAEYVECRQCRGSRASLRFI